MVRTQGQTTIAKFFSCSHDVIFRFVNAARENKPCSNTGGARLKIHPDFQNDVKNVIIDDKKDKKAINVPQFHDLLSTAFTNTHF